jgi:methylenetetrahydrofolate dehydrogenase (NADP+)/methenyltetrahydrofolate cyclohydrolase
MKVLNGLELAEFIEERQVHDVRRLRQAEHVQPKLAILVTIEHPAIDVYMRMKQRYGTDILVDVDVHRVQQSEVRQVIMQLNDDPSVHGIIVQLPLEDPSETDEIINLVARQKDVDGLASVSDYEPATALAILWLLNGYNVELGASVELRCYRS